MKMIYEVYEEYQWLFVLISSAESLSVAPEDRENFRKLDWSSTDDSMPTAGGFIWLANICYLKSNTYLYRLSVKLIKSKSKKMAAFLRDTRFIGTIQGRGSRMDSQEVVLWNYHKNNTTRDVILGAVHNCGCQAGREPENTWMQPAERGGAARVAPPHTYSDWLKFNRLSQAYMIENVFVVGVGRRTHFKIYLKGMHLKI